LRANRRKRLARSRPLLTTPPAGGYCIYLQARHPNTNVKGAVQDAASAMKASEVSEVAVAVLKVAADSADGLSVDYDPLRKALGKFKRGPERNKVLADLAECFKNVTPMLIQIAQTAANQLGETERKREHRAAQEPEAKDAENEAKARRRAQVAAALAANRRQIKMTSADDEPFQGAMGGGVSAADLAWKSLTMVPIVDSVIKDDGVANTLTDLAPRGDPNAWLPCALQTWMQRLQTLMTEGRLKKVLTQRTRNGGDHDADSYFRKHYCALDERAHCARKRQARSLLTFNLFLTTDFQESKRLEKAVQEILKEKLPGAFFAWVVDGNGGAGEGPAGTVYAVTISFELVA